MANGLTAIVTGATGGLGRNLVARLQSEGWQVIAFGRNQAIGKTLGVPFRAVDLRQPEQVLQHFQQADAVFHCAALSSPWGRFEDFYQANVVATQNVIHAARHYQIGKFIHVSSPSIYFDFQDHIDVREDFVARRFVNDYAYTKFLAEQAVISAYDVSSVIIRPRAIFGEYDTAVLPRLLAIAEKGFLPLVQRPNQNIDDVFLDATYVGNVVDALLLAYEHDVPNGMTFNISNGTPLTIRQLYQKIIDVLDLKISFKTVPYVVLDNIARILEMKSRLQMSWQHQVHEPILTRYSVGVIAYSQTLNLDRAKQFLAYQANISIDEGLQRYAKHLMETRS